MEKYREKKIFWNLIELWRMNICFYTLCTPSVAASQVLQEKKSETLSE